MISDGFWLSREQPTACSGFLGWGLSSAWRRPRATPIPASWGGLARNPFAELRQVVAELLALPAGDRRAMMTCA